MLPLKKLYKVRANSLLESVVALSIIAVCLYIAIVVYAAVFAPGKSVRHYSSYNSVYNVFFDYEIGDDSLTSRYDDSWDIDQVTDEGINQLLVKHKDSIGVVIEKHFFLNGDEQ